jgi:hypothetical protein
MRHLDSAAAKANTFLVVVAIGLATLTLTSFSVLAIKDALPPITRVSCPVPTAGPLAASQSVTTEVSKRRVTTGAADTVNSNRPSGKL